jgi:hypothetical protein
LNNFNSTLENEDNIIIESTSDRETSDLNLISQSYHQQHSKGLVLNQIPFTSHENLQLKTKSTIPKKHHSGKLNLNLIESKLERAKSKSVRRKTLLKKVI